MDKQMIIDGVDVSGCSCLEQDGNEFYCGEYNRNVYCNCNTNCYYKQLKRAEQECDQLKAENEILEKINKNNQEKIKKLNETLEEEFIAKQYGDEALFFTLMDIKEIAEPYNDMSGNCVILNCFEDMNRILQKISECEVGNEK